MSNDPFRLIRNIVRYAGMPVLLATGVWATFALLKAGYPRSVALTVSSSITFLVLLAPFAPHLAEELWRALGNPKSLALEPWPAVDPALLIEATWTLVVQVGGKVRDRIEVADGAPDEEILAAAKSAGNVARHLEGMTIVKEIVVPGKLVNLVVKPA